MSGLSKFGRVLTVVFAVSLVGLVAELLYVLWRRRVIRRQSRTVHDAEDHNPDFSTDPPKELLYFFCLKSQSRLEPDRAPTCASDGSAADDPVEVIDLFKLQEMYGRSRVLFTINEEREDLESEKSLSCDEKGSKKTKKTCLEERFEVVGESPEVALTIDATPFSTPCASPLYLTPPVSPSRETERGLCAVETEL